MMKEINRDIYYKENYESFLIFLVSRLYNDLQLNSSLLKSITGQNTILTANAEIYLFKVLISHLKEGLKTIGKMKRSSKYGPILEEWMNSNNTIKSIIEDISDELEPPKDYPNTVNAKYLEMRNEVFHYCIDNSSDFEYYKICQRNLILEGYDVCIDIEKHGKYNFEVGVDIPITKNIYSEEAFLEVDKLKNKLIVLTKEILSDYYNKIK